MKNKIITAGALLLTLTVSSCHKDADVMLNYAYNDNLAFEQANESFAGKFRVFWNAMNQNYTLWDYEKENGLDWDAVYDEYLPKFEALDEPDAEVTDSILEALTSEVVAPLHDGHMFVEFKNHKTNNTVFVSPSSLRNYARTDMEEANGFVPTIYNYGKELKRYMSYDASIYGQLRSMLTRPDVGRQWVKTRIEELEAKSSLTESEVILYEGLRSLDAALDKLVEESINTQWVNEYNSTVEKYSYLNVPFLEQVDPRLFDNGMRLEFALTKDNIAYLQLSQFSLTVFLSDEDFQENLGGFARNNEIRQNVIQVWQAWFDTIQNLHKSGQLNGVIIDLRGNPGGFMNDANYVLGALLPSGGLQYGWSRFKRGVGRYDFSPLMPKIMSTMKEQHEVVDDKPIVVLVNARSVSMSEMTSLSAQQLKNGTVMGRRTYGGLCGLTSNTYNSDNYSGHIGVRGTTPVYVYMPTECILNMDKKPLDGIGVTPDIEAPLDVDLYEESGKDTQIERALQYIRTGQ